MDNSLVQVGSLRITRQALTICIAGILLACVLIFTLGLSPGSVLAAAFILLAIFVAAYSVNCMVVGHCRIWAWFLAVLYVVNLILYTLVLMIPVPADSTSRLSNKVGRAKASSR